MKRNTWPPIIAGMSYWERVEFMRWLEWLRIDPDKATDEELIRAARRFYVRIIELYPEIVEEG